jgi:hypothetical protein
MLKDFINYIEKNFKINKINYWNNKIKNKFNNNKINKLLNLMILNIN